MVIHVTTVKGAGTRPTSTKNGLAYSIGRIEYHRKEECEKTDREHIEYLKKLSINK